MASVHRPGALVARMQAAPGPVAHRLVFGSAGEGSAVFEPTPPTPASPHPRPCDACRQPPAQPHTAKLSSSAGEGSEVFDPALLLTPRPSELMLGQDFSRTPSVVSLRRVGRTCCRCITA